MPGMPKIPPNKSGKSRNEIQTNYDCIKLPRLRMYVSGTRFKQAGKRGGNTETDAKLQQVVADMFPLQRENTEQLRSQKRGVGKD